MSNHLDWLAVRDFLYRRPVVPTTTAVGPPTVLPIAGAPDWVALDDDDPRKAAALMVAGSRWVLETRLDQLEARRYAAKRAAIEVSRSRDWAAVAKRIRDRDQWDREHPDLKRKKAS